MAGPLFFDRVREYTTTGSTATIILGGAVNGFRTFSSVLNNGDTCFYCIEDTANGLWEVGLGTYNAPANAVARTYVISSSNGISPVSFFPNNKTIFIVSPASATPGINPALAGGRLTLTSGTPVTTSDVFSASTIYYTPYLNDNIALYDGYTWRRVLFSETSLALGTLTANLPYDVGAYIVGTGGLGGGTLGLQLSAWASSSVRANPLYMQNGVLVWGSGGTVYRYLGTIHTDSSGLVDDSALQRFCWNYNNRVARRLQRVETTGAWTDTTVGWRQANNNTANKVEVIVGYADSLIDLSILAMAEGYGSGNVTATIAIGEDAITAPAAECIGGSTSVMSSSFYAHLMTKLCKIPQAGYHAYNWLEDIQPQMLGAGATFFGAQTQSGMIGYIMG